MLKLAQIFQSNMVLQRDKTVNIWGKTDENIPVKVKIQGRQFETVADAKGNFLVEISFLTTSEDETMIIIAGQSELKLEHVAVGEVWIAGGQSNMEFFMEFEKHMAEERNQCENSRIRFYDVPEIAFEGQLEAFDYSKVGVWRSSTMEDIGYFSAVGYYFEKELSLALDVPVGIIGCNWGGTRAASWMNPETVKEIGKFWMEEYERESARLDMSVYFEEQKTVPQNDRGSLLDDPFMRFMMPVTHTADENMRFLAKAGSKVEDFIGLLNPQNIPGSLYHHMLKTIAGFANRGVLWYQGESDDEIDGGQEIYGDMLAALIQDWRNIWKEELPFLVVQLPGWERWLDNTNRNYAAIREGQKRVSKEVEHVYLCSIGDVGEQFDIHPKDKKTVGIRLAMLALGHVYEKRILCDAPECISGSRQDNCIVLTFSNIGDGLQVDGNEINALNVTANGNSIDFKSFVLNGKVLVQFDQIPETPVTVLFAQNLWYQINLYNSAGIPAIPFQITL